MDDFIESKLSMSLDALIKQQKKNLPKKAPKKKQAAARVKNNALNGKVCGISMA
jgi:hypothetical protein